jgi:hypothetical protein
MQAERCLEFHALGDRKRNGALNLKKKKEREKSQVEAGSREERALRVTQMFKCFMI